MSPAPIDWHELRLRLAAPNLQEAAPTGDGFAHEPTRLIPAAVLVGIVMSPEPGILLTKRTAHLRQHAGQVSFPGGRIDATDPTPEAAALREAQEEIGLDPAQVELVGRLPDYITSTAYRVTPVLGLVAPGAVLNASAHEVEAVFELPLRVVLDEAAPQAREAMFRGSLRRYWVWPHESHEIWGATAGMLLMLAAKLRQGGPLPFAKA